MMSVYVLKHLMDVDEWVSQRENYSYSMSVNKWGTSFWVFNHKTQQGQSIFKVSDIDLEKLESEKVCEKSEEQKSATSYGVEQNGIMAGTNA